MYLSNVDIKQEIEAGRLIFDPPPQKIDPTSIDLHLDRIEEARIWNLQKFLDKQREQGEDRPELRIGKYNLAKFSADYLASPPSILGCSDSDTVVCRGHQCIVRPGGFLLWQTKERVGTSRDKPGLICFVDGKSTRARAGIVVHLTAPTIHAGWSGKITLEIANLGPFDLRLEENDVLHS
jgi:dCTP deaminase